MDSFPPTYCVRVNGRARNVIIKLIPGRGIEVVLPRGVDAREVPLFLERKREWIEEGIRRLAAKGLSLAPQKLVMPDEISFAATGESFEIRRVRNRKPGLTLRRNAGKLQLSGTDWTELDELELFKNFVRGEARKFLVPELQKLSSALNLPFGRVAIRSQRKRWGSCSVKGNINLNMKLMFLPFRLVRYILIHELCHTVHLNHSAKYWNLVRMVEPEVDELEKELAEAGRLIPEWVNHL